MKQNDSHETVAPSHSDGHFVRIGEAWSHWYVRLGMASSIILLLFLVILDGTWSGPTASVHFIPRQQWEAMNKLPEQAHWKEIERLNNLFSRDEILNLQSKRFGNLVSLLEMIEQIPKIICAGIVIAGSGCLAEIAYRKITASNHRP